MRRVGPSWIAVTLSLAMFAFLLVLGAPPVSADSISFDLAVGNDAISGFTGPYAGVTVNRSDKTHATVTFTSRTVGGYTYLMGGGGSVALNVRGTATAMLGTPTTTVGGFDPGPVSLGNPGTEDGFGTFSLTVNDFDGFRHAFTRLVVTLTATDSTKWGSANSVLVANALGSRAAAHIFVANAAACGTEACATGFAGNGSVGPVPEPGTLALVGLGLVGLVWVARQRSSGTRRDV